MIIDNNTFNHIIDNIEGTAILKSNVHGYGLFAIEDIEFNTCLTVLDGQVISWSLYNELSEKFNNSEDRNELFIEWNALAKDTLLVRQ